VIVLARFPKSVSKAWIRVPALLITCAVLLGVESPLVAAPASGAVASRRDAVVADRGIELLRGLRDPKAPPPEESGAALADLGSGVIGVLIDALETRQIPDVQGAGAEPQILSRPQRETILVALEHLGRAAVMPAFEQRLTEPEDYGQRRAAVEVLGAVAEGRELGRLLTCTVDPTTASYDAKLSESLEDSVCRTLRRDSYGFQVLERLLGDIDQQQLEAVILGVGRTRDPAGLDVLVAIPWANERHRVQIAAQIPLLAPSNDPGLNRDMADRMLKELSAPNENLVNAAILALSHLEDFSCVPQLIELLDEESPRLRASAHHALCKLTAKSTVASIGVWRHWYRAEDQWARADGVRAVDALLSGPEKEALAALVDIGAHRLERHQLALETSVALFHDSARVRLKACETLTGLGSRWAVDGLREALRDPSDDVRTAALVALQAITGEQRGEDYAAWEDYSAPDPRSAF